MKIDVDDIQIVIVNRPFFLFRRVKGSLTRSYPADYIRVESGTYLSIINVTEPGVILSTMDGEYIWILSGLPHPWVRAPSPLELLACAAEENC